MARTRVLVVDDSAFARKVIREALSASPHVEVVGTARDGLEALEKIAELSPDVITLDLVMPNLDGIGVLRALPAAGAPRVVVVSISDAESALAIEAFESGAVELVHKPTALATERLYELSAELVTKVVAAGKASAPRAIAPPPPRTRTPTPVPPARLVGRAKVLVIGTSTGGPNALTRLLPALPADFPIPIAVALHIPEGFTQTLAKRIGGLSKIRVVEASDGMVLEAGTALIARGGAHLELQRVGEQVVARVSNEKRDGLYTPSVNVLFESAAKAYGEGTLGLVLTGMGDDGLLGSRAIHAAGGRVLTEREISCIVYGMPRAVDEAGVSAGSAALEEMPAEILRQL